MPPRWQLDDEADLEGAVIDAMPTLTASTVTVARMPEQANGAQRVSAEHPFLRRYDHHTDPSASVPYRRVGAPLSQGGFAIRALQ